MYNRSVIFVSLSFSFQSNLQNENTVISTLSLPLASAAFCSAQKDDKSSAVSVDMDSLSGRDFLKAGISKSSSDNSSKSMSSSELSVRIDMLSKLSEILKVSSDKFSIFALILSFNPDIFVVNFFMESVVLDTSFFPCWASEPYPDSWPIEPRA